MTALWGGKNPRAERRFSELKTSSLRTLKSVPPTRKVASCTGTTAVLVSEIVQFCTSTQGNVRK